LPAAVSSPTSTPSSSPERSRVRLLRMPDQLLLYLRLQADFFIDLDLENLVYLMLF